MRTKKIYACIFTVQIKRDGEGHGNKGLQRRRKIGRPIRRRNRRARARKMDNSERDCNNCGQVGKEKVERVGAIAGGGFVKRGGVGPW